MTEKEEAFLAGIQFAADIVRDHWNTSDQMVNQKDQAERSANALLSRIVSFDFKLEKKYARGEPGKTIPE